MTLDDSASGKIESCSLCGVENGDNGTKLKACGNCKATFYCDAKCQRSHWKSHKTICQKITKSGKTAQSIDNKPDPTIHVPEHPRLVDAAQAWRIEHEHAIRQYAIQCSGILPLKPGFNEPTHQTMITLCEGLFPGDLLIMVTMRLPLSMYYKISPSSKVSDEKHLKIAASRPGCVGGAPYMISCGGTMMPYMAYVGEDECAGMKVEDVSKWTPMECRSHFEKLLTEESGGKRKIWSSMISLGDLQA